jgi:cell filamentation protein
MYEWAGQLRTVDIAKGNNRFAHHAHVADAAKTIFHQLAVENHLAELDPNAFSDRSAHYLAEMNALHPFREGNGRALREFISHLPNANGYYLAWENTAPAEVLQASIESFSGRTTRLAAIIRDNLDVSRP